MPKSAKKAAHAVPTTFTVDFQSSPVVNPKNVEPVYSNNAGLLMTPHDLRIVFTEIVTTALSQPPAIELRANVTMSPTQFKAFADAVEKTVVAYEKAHGEIPWPPKNQPSVN